MIGLAMKSKCDHEGMWFGQVGELDLIWWGMPLEENSVYLRPGVEQVLG